MSIVNNDLAAVVLTLKQPWRRDRLISSARRAIVVEVLESTRREFGGAGRAGTGVVDVGGRGGGSRRRKLIASLFGMNPHSLRLVWAIVLSTACI
jgi:hypothetical protein